MILKQLIAGWVNDNVGFSFLLENLDERGNKTRLGAGMEKVGGRWTGILTKVITRLKDGVVAVRFDNDSSR